MRTILEALFKNLPPVSPVQNGVKWATIASWNPAFFGGQQLSAGIHCQLFLDRDSLVS